MSRRTAILSVAARISLDLAAAGDLCRLPDLPLGGGLLFGSRGTWPLLHSVARGDPCHHVGSREQPAAAHLEHPGRPSLTGH